MERLALEDLLLIAELVLDVPGEQLARRTRLDAAAAAIAASERRSAVADRAATLCHRLVRDRPFPCGNKPVALLAMLELLSRSQATWIPPDGGAQELATTVERLASGELSATDFAAWVGWHVRTR